MRRKSERNKAKASPEKKPEKPTRKSTRRRGKRSPSTSPDRENSNDAAALSTRESDGEAAMHTRVPSRECGKIEEIPESNVSLPETIVKQQEQQQEPQEELQEPRSTSPPLPPPQQQQQQQQQPQQQQPEEEEDAGSVWKVARADASPGEIQKLKLCRQRNMSETSDSSSSRKRTNKWHEAGDGAAEEADSAEEPPTAASKLAVEREEPAEKANSAPPARDSSEEVSDSKEIRPPEAASPEFSDDKPNIDDDRQGETIETPMICTAVERVDDNKPAVAPEPSPPEEATATTDVGSNGEPSEDQSPKADTATKLGPPEEPADSAKPENTIADNRERDATRPSKVESSTEDDEEKPRDSRKKTARKRSESSEDNTDEERSKSTARKTLQRSTSRRKHRDKYRESSNSDTAESEDDCERTERSKRAKPTQESREDRRKVTEEEKKEPTEKPSRTPETRSDTPTDNDAPMEIENNKSENEKPKENEKSERLDPETVAAAPVVAQSINSYKPAKVNLKRSFAGRISADTVEAKKEGTDNHANDLANQDKENHASSAQVDPKSIPKKRRWGTIFTSTAAAPAFSVSTDSLKVLVPGAKPLSITEVRLSKDDDEEKERRSQREKRYSAGEAGGDHKSREEGEKPKSADAKKDAKGDNHIASRRKISIIKDNKSPSPPAAIPTSILLIKNLVRPFTLNQIRELLSRTGTIVENGFWMDRIKSKCFVEYSNEDQAFETRQALHGISWPVSNPKRLQVEYATKEDMASAREQTKDQPISRKAEPLAANDGWQQDWARDERPNAATKVTVVREWDLGKEDGQHFAKDKEREKKDHDKKRRQRSRSPILDAHLPAPARKFKKKEDDPPPAKLLDDLFRKTKATPCIYWLPLTNEQIVVKEEMRRQHMAEHARRLEEMRRAERNRDGRRRRSPRK